MTNDELQVGPIWFQSVAARLQGLLTAFSSQLRADEPCPEELYAKVRGIVDVLPLLNSPAAIARHLREYFAETRDHLAVALNLEELLTEEELTAPDAAVA